MTTHSRAALLAFAFLASACGGNTPEDEHQASLGIRDTLVPVADAPRLPDTVPPAPPETVYVEKPATTPPVASAPRPRPTLPAAPTARPTPPPPTAKPKDADPTPAAPVAPSRRSLASGTALQTTLVDSIHSRYTKVGDVIRLRVTRDYSDASGKIVVPAGSVVMMAVTAIQPAPNRNSTGTLVLAARSVQIEGESMPLVATATDYDFELKARGIGTGEVAKTGAGAVAGGILGRVIGGKKGTIVGAIGGAAAGAAVAGSTADRDIIVHAGMPMTITLSDPFERH